jgi:hypothetical protein
MGFVASVVKVGNGIKAKSFDSLYMLRDMTSADKLFLVNAPSIVRGVPIVLLRGLISPEQVGRTNISTLSWQRCSMARHPALSNVKKPYTSSLQARKPGPFLGNLPQESSFQLSLNRGNRRKSGNYCARVLIDPPFCSVNIQLGRMNKENIIGRG